MITEDYVDFEISNLLKEKGFNETCEMFYCKPHEGYLRNIKRNEWQNSDLRKDMICTCPTVQMTMKWLRQVHGLFIHIDVIREASCWLVDIQDIKGDVKVYPVKKEFPNYEEACKGGIKYCIENLI